MGLLGVILAAGDDVTVSLNEKGLPGSNVAKGFAGGMVFYALIFVLVGLVLSAGMWAVGAFSSNYTQSVNGKKGFLICAGAALAIGAANGLVAWFRNQGGTIQGTNGAGTAPK